MRHTNTKSASHLFVVATDTLPPMTNEKSQIIAEIHKLIDEQFALIRAGLTDAEVVAFAERKRQITELINRLNGDGLKTE